MKKFVMVAGAVAGVVFGTASAEGLITKTAEGHDFYISAFGGGSFLGDSEFSGISAPEAGVPGPTGAAGVPLNVDLDYSSSYFVGGNVGYQPPVRVLGVFQPRFEIELSYLENDIDNGSFNGGAQVFGGEQEALFLYVNNYTDLKFSQNQKFVPYVGGGIGVAFVDSNVGYFPPALSAPNFEVSGEDTALAGHIAVGGTYELTDNFELFTEGRYFRINNVSLERRFIGGGADLFVGDVEDDIDGFTVAGGLRYRF